jgi:hypothetical protein
MEGSNKQQVARKELQGWDQGTRVPRNRSAKDGTELSFMQSTTKAKEWKKFCAEHEGQGGTRKMSQQPGRRTG